MKLCKNDLVLCCDATNSLDLEFLQIAVKHFQEDPLICSASGIIKAKSVKGTVSRWRSRHLFKEGISYPPEHITRTSLVTYGTLVKRSIILNAGNFDSRLQHSEDEDLGLRLLKLGYKSIGDPKLITYSEVDNSLIQVLERHWRWHIGKRENLSFKSYLHIIRGSLNPMVIEDFKSGDPLSSLISLLYPHFFLIKTIKRKYF
jgi:GT2 family glycosyltransferase